MFPNFFYDQAFGFIWRNQPVAEFLHHAIQIADYGAARRFSGPLLAAGMAAGLSAELLRIGMGAHFFSDVIYAGVFMTLTIAGLHAAIFGPARTLGRWRRWTPWCDSRWPVLGWWSPVSSGGSQR